MYYAELKLMGYTDAELAAKAGAMFKKEIELDGSDDPLTRSRRSLWFREYTQRIMGSKTVEVPGFVGATEREPPPEPKPYPAENDIPGAVAWLDHAMDDGSYVSERDIVNLHMLNADHYKAFEAAVDAMRDRRRAEGKWVPE